MTIRIELDEIKRWNNRHSYQRVPRATCGNREVVGYDAIVRKLCRELAEMYSPDEPVEVYRAGTLCFKPAPLSVFTG